MKKRLLPILFCILFLTACNTPNTQKHSERGTPLDAVPVPSVTPQNMPTPTPVPATPEKTPQTKKAEPVQVSTFSTKIVDKKPERVNNIKLAAEAVSGTVLAPKETFSFNGIVGKRTSAKGYEEAPIIVNKEKEYAVGGGVCQLSTTIFNAASDAGMTITERHFHGVPVPYIEEGKDAAVTYEGKDLKFVNSTGYNIKIVATVTNEAVTVKFYRLSE